MKYRYYALKRILLVIPTFLGVSLILWYLLIELYNGDPLAPYISWLEALRLTPADRAALMHRYGLDRPWYERYLQSVINILQGNWGIAHIYGDQPVLPLVKRAFITTAEVGIYALILSLLIGIPLGIKSSISSAKKDIYITTSSLIGYAAPAFLVAIIIRSLIYEFFFYFASRFHVSTLNDFSFYTGRFNTKFFSYPDKLIFGLPTTGFITFDSLFSLNIPLFVDSSLHMIGPIIVISIALIPIIVKMTRHSMVDVLKQDYILLAKSKGLKERTILYRHAFRNALIPLLTITAITFSTLLISSIYTDIIFDYPGLGLFLYGGINFFDMPVFQGFITISALVFILFNLVVDLFYGIADPRIRI